MRYKYNPRKTNNSAGGLSKIDKSFYQLFHHIRARCCYPTDKDYQRYGGRGITVYEPWRTDRKEFLRYLVSLDGWDDPKRDLDRIDNNLGYAPNNLRFATKSENARNKRRVGELELRIQELEKENTDLRHRLFRTKK